jgi:hypothetical protein
MPMLICSIKMANAFEDFRGCAYCLRRYRKSQSSAKNKNAFCSSSCERKEKQRDERGY